MIINKGINLISSIEKRLRIEKSCLKVKLTNIYQLSLQFTSQPYWIIIRQGKYLTSQVYMNNAIEGYLIYINSKPIIVNKHGKLNYESTNGFNITSITSPQPSNIIVTLVSDCIEFYAEDQEMPTERLELVLDNINQIDGQIYYKDGYYSAGQLILNSLNNLLKRVEIYGETGVKILMDNGSQPIIIGQSGKVVLNNIHSISMPPNEPKRHLQIYYYI